MPVPVEARFWWSRALGLWRRGVARLRTRGVAASWQRVVQYLQRPTRLPHNLYAPAATPFAAFSLATSSLPRASVIIPIYGAWAHTLACLRALAEHPPRTPFEVIVVDDASPDDSLQHLHHIDGIRVHARAQNGGFIAACNAGAALAQGEFLVFLNNDTVPQPGWLDALLDTFDQHPSTNTRMRAWWARNWSIRMAACKRPAGWSLPMATVGTTGGLRTQTIARTDICAMPIMSAVPPLPCRVGCSSN